MMQAARRFGRDETVTAVTQAASLWTQPTSIGARWRMVAELHGPVAMAHLAHGEPFLPLAAFVDGLTGPLAELLPLPLRQPCDNAALIEDGQLSITAADLLTENLAPSLSAADVASWSMPRLSAEKVQGWLYGQLLATGSEAGYRNARRTVIDKSAGEMSDVIDAIKLAGLPREGLVTEIPGHTQIAHEGEKYWFGCPICRYPMRFQLGKVSCMYPPHARAVGAATVKLSRRRQPSVGAWNKARAAELGGPGVITAAPVDGHACLVHPVWRYSTIPGCEEVRLHQLLEQTPGVTATLWPYTDRYDLHVSAASRRKPWRVDVKDYADAARLANELLKRGTLTDSDLLIVVPDHRADQLAVLNERLRAGLNTRRRIAYNSSSFLKLVQRAA